ncbi:methionine ABC transporter ATP-binding protein [Pseudoclavibacter sp. JSM 162008]|uniref:methionine ABC transporter ATP-binding protein n=1 Tax=Pseudoclavibacter sp. JSM 162008 TaxID=3229855 RepID=UPI003524699B
MALITLTDVVKEYPAPKRGAPVIRAVDGVSLNIEAGDIYGVIGYSGAGKSTMVRLINALEPTTSGSIHVDGVDITKLPETKLRSVRAGIGMIFQQFNLFNSRNVAGNVAYPLRVAKTPKAEREKRVAELLEFVGLSEKARAFPDQLSGGQKQRVGIARALATNPSILLADESTSALDPQTTADVLQLLKKANEELGVTIIVITHEMDVVKEIASHVAVMEHGKIVEQGEVFDIFANPEASATQRFVSTVVQGIPDAELRADLGARHPGTLVTLSFRDGRTNQGQALRILHEAGITVELVYGGMNEIRGKSFGDLTFALQGDADARRRALDEIGGLAVVTEFDDITAGGAA